MAEDGQVAILTNVRVIGSSGQYHKICKIGLDWKLVLEGLGRNVGGRVWWRRKGELTIFQKVRCEWCGDAEDDKPEDENEVTIFLKRLGQSEWHVVGDVGVGEE